MDPAWGDALADPNDMGYDAAAPAAAPVAVSSGSRGGARPAGRAPHASSQGRGRGLGDAMHEAFTQSTAREDQRNQATDVAAMEARLARMLQLNHAEMMRAQEPQAGRGKGRGKANIKAQFPTCYVDRATNMMKLIKNKGSRSDDGGSVMFNFRKTMVFSEHTREDFTGYVWTDAMIGLATKFVMRTASRVYPEDMTKVGYNDLPADIKLKFDNAVIVPHVMEWRRIHLSALRTHAREFFWHVESIEKELWEDSDVVSDIEHRAILAINTRQNIVRQQFFDPIEGWFNKPSFVIFLAKVQQHLQTYSHYGVRDLSVADIAFHCDAVAQHYKGTKVANR